MKRLIVVLGMLCCITFNSVSQSLNRRWYMPDFLTAQYAGSIGFISGGAGYEIFRKKAGVELLVGVVPGFIDSAPLETINLKFTGSIINVKINEAVTLTPLTAGLFFCYTPGIEYSSDLPSWYPEGYYWWSEAVRVNIFIGGHVSAMTDRFGRSRKVQAYYEIGTNEIKLVSYIQNSDALTVWNILHAGIGVRYFFSDIHR
ncbi:hypothetical protein [Pseudochryseolinea flava]|uniref:Outer membrane protein beta-barrel domain-containing protein n=1 Tax=Pseudochryseolinea flava TaxID=2059302 RepID=A0A364Y5U9_9BACT|nr:hypothetical protein [Pseudochryseolinea flava]RAW01605.1 hypothetical protein DQQ10_08070 [Pseudochryseolinea flava]